MHAQTRNCFSRILVIASISSAFWLTNCVAAEPTPIGNSLIILGCRPNYQFGEIINISVKNSGSNILEGQMNIEWKLADKWYCTTPYLGAEEVTKTSKIEKFDPNVSKNYRINGENMPAIFRTKPGEYRIIFIPRSALDNRPPGPAIVLGGFTVSEKGTHTPAKINK